MKDGRGVKRFEFSCNSGKITWHGPYGGLLITIKGPAYHHELCIQAKALNTSAIVSIMENSSTPKRLITIEEKKDNKTGQERHTMCFPAHGDSVFFVETDRGAFVSAKVILDYYIETQPKYGDQGKR